MDQMPTIQKMTSSKHNSFSLPVNDKKMPDDKHILANNQNRENSLPTKQKRS